MCASVIGYAQNVGINTTGDAPHASAGLDVNFTTKGFLAPRMLLSQKLAIVNPANGLLIYQLDGVQGFYYYSTTSNSWVYNSSGSQWTTSGSNIYYTAGKVGIGTSSTPAYALTVNAPTNPLYLSGVVEGSGLDSILIISNGVVKKLVYSATASSDSWSLTGNLGQTVALGRFIGTKDANPLRFRTNNIQRMYVHESLGGVAIGENPIFTIANPEKLLVDIGGTALAPVAVNNFNAIKATGFINNYLQLNVHNKHAGVSSSSDIVATADNGSETNNYVDLGINSSTNTSGVFGSFRDAYLYNLGEDFLIGAGTTGKSLKFLTGGTSETANTRMVIDGDGSVGIGTTNTTTGKVSVNAGTGLSLPSTTALYLTGGNNGVLQLNIQNTGEGDGSSVSSDIVATASNGNDSTNYINMGINGGNNVNDGSLLSGPNKAYFYANSKDMYIGNGGQGFSLLFFTNSGQAGELTANGTVRMTINSTGQVSIGGAASGAHKLTVSGSLIATNIFTNSDRRLKTNIQPLNYGLKEILQLRPVTYNWIDTTQTRQLQLGLIAQETKAVIPEMVAGDESKETLGIDYSMMVPVLINGIKEQQQQIEDLKKRSEKNKALIESIQKELNNK
jgi:hypothetical protein